jgi:membrane protein YqaA with SNARE-associated domain
MIAQAFAKLPEELSAWDVFTHPDFLMLAGVAFIMAVVGGVVSGIVSWMLGRWEREREERRGRIRHIRHIRRI